jgi:glycosyltransferase involved in cell wall biosynthesis
LLALAGLLVLPSLTGGIALTLLEAMARGLPVVATRTGGNPELFVKGATGLLVPAGDGSALARAPLELGRDPYRGWRMVWEGHYCVE